MILQACNESIKSANSKNSAHSREMHHCVQILCTKPGAGPSLTPNCQYPIFPNLTWNIEREMQRPAQTGRRRQWWKMRYCARNAKLIGFLQQCICNVCVRWWSSQAVDKLTHDVFSRVNVNLWWWGFSGTQCWTLRCCCVGNYGIVSSCCCCRNGGERGEAASLHHQYPFSEWLGKILWKYIN